MRGKEVFSYVQSCQGGPCLLYTSILISVFTDSNFSHDGLTGAGMTWTTSGEVNKDPKVYVIKDGAYAVAE